MHMAAVISRLPVPPAIMKIPGVTPSLITPKYRMDSSLSAHMPKFNAVIATRFLHMQANFRQPAIRIVIRATRLISKKLTVAAISQRHAPPVTMKTHGITLSSTMPRFRMASSCSVLTNQLHAAIAIKFPLTKPFLRPRVTRIVIRVIKKIITVLMVPEAAFQRPAQIATTPVPGVMSILNNTTRITFQSIPVRTQEPGVLVKHVTLPKATIRPSAV